MQLRQSRLTTKTNFTEICVLHLQSTLSNAPAFHKAARPRPSVVGDASGHISVHTTDAMWPDASLTTFEGGLSDQITMHLQDAPNPAHTST